MKTTWWCLASPGAAPRAVGADSRENEPRRQVWMYGTLVETASTPRERVHRWSTPLKDVPGGSAPRSTEVVGRPIAKRASLGTQIQRTIITARSQRQICARESPGILQASEVPFIQDGQAGRQRERVPCLGSRGRRGSGDGNEPRLVFFKRPSLMPPFQSFRSGAAFRRTRGDEMAPVGKKPSHAGKAVVAGGISGAVEICCTYPVSRLTCDPMTAPPTPSVPPSTVRARSLHRLSSPRQCSSCPPRMCLPWRS